MSVVLPFLLRLVRVICLVIFEAKILSPFAYFLFHDMCPEGIIRPVIIVSVGVLLVSEGIIRPVVSVLVLT